MKIDLKKFDKLIEQKYISRKKHPTEDLYIFNYTQLCQFARAWTEETLMARGLITDLEGNIKARPFKKFFNYEEHFGEDCKLPSLPLEKFTVTEKMDGSLGIMYWVDDVPHIATRGSFTSDQAIKANEMLERISFKYDPKYTFLFEIIYPANRIVVDYGGLEELTLLTVIETESGKELSREEIIDFGICPWPIVPSYNFDSIEKIKQVQKENTEGFVIRFQSGVRTKIKMAEYVRLHRLVTGVNAKTIWELLKNGHDFTDLLERVPDEFYDWVKNTRALLEAKFSEISLRATKIWSVAKELPTRKEQARYINKADREVSGIVFKMLDGHEFDSIIWKMIKPKAEKPWKEES